MLAHQGGWDETIYVLVPIAVIVLLLRVAKRRSTTGSPDPGDSGPDTPAR